MTHEHEDNIDFNSIQEKNLEALQESINHSITEVDNDFDADVLVESYEAEKVCIRLADEKEEKILSVSQGEQKKINALSQSEESDTDPLESVSEETNAVVTQKTLFQKVVSFVQFVCKYIMTASFIFVVLMLSTNYSAYITIAKSYLNPELIEESEKNIQKSIEVSQIEVAKREQKGPEESVEDGEGDDSRAVDDYDSKDLRNIIGDIRTEDIALDIEIIPFVNRIVIPKIGKNIPLIDINRGSVEGLDELNEVFMDELEGGVVRYPGSALPGEYGNSFVFGHSSNFPWMAGDYNDVFALLDKLEIGDEVISYYEGQKYTYKIHEKRVIRPDDVEVLKRDTGRREMTLMTCWPIGTTYNRLLVIGELVK